MTIDAEVQRLLDELQRGLTNWINGRTEAFDPSVIVQSPDQTIYGPFGGEILRLSADVPVEERQQAISARFQMGTGTSEVVRVMRSDDLVVVVLLERSEVMFEGRSDPQPWILRTTQVFEHDGSRWVRLHRHADPLSDIRTFEATLDVAAGAMTS